MKCKDKRIPECARYAEVYINYPCTRHTIKRITIAARNVKLPSMDETLIKF